MAPACGALVLCSVGKGVWTRDPAFEKGNKGMKITHEYKHEEGSKGEREAVKMAMKTARYKRDESTGHFESLVNAFTKTSTVTTEAIGPAAG